MHLSPSPVIRISLTLGISASKAWTFANVKAGSDSTASVMQTMLYQLLRHPDSMNRLLEELSQTTVENSTSDDMPLPAWKSIRNLDYLDACFIEALRLHPPFCLPLERVVQRGGIIISGHYLPQGTVVGINPYVSNRNPSLFGKDVSEWRPERWIGLDPAQRQRMERGVLSVCPWPPQYSVRHFLCSHCCLIVRSGSSIMFGEKHCDS